MPSQRLTLVGIGNMGAAMGHALRKAGTPMTIWNRTADRPRVKALVEAGADFEADVGTAISRSDGVVIICVLECDMVYGILSAETTGNSLAGKTIVNLCTSTPRQAREAAAWFKGRGALRYFDGGIMAMPEMVGTADGFIVYSGEDEQSFSGSVAELLRPLGAAQYEGPDPGAAATLDLAALAAMYGMFAGGFVGMALLKRRAGSGGPSPGGQSCAAPGVGRVMAPWVRSLVPYLNQMASIADDKQWEDELGSPLGMQLLALRKILQACDEEGVDAGGLEALAAHMQRAIDDKGWGCGLAMAGKYALK